MKKVEGFSSLINKSRADSVTFTRDLTEVVVVLGAQLESEATEPLTFFGQAKLELSTGCCRRPSKTRAQRGSFGGLITKLTEKG